MIMLELFIKNNKQFFIKISYNFLFDFLDDENSHVHAVLTSDNLLDGTISTGTEQYYVEPSHRYSDQLPKVGIHSIVYKVSDVKIIKSMYPSSETGIPTGSAEHCASEKLRKKILKNTFERKSNSNFEGIEKKNQSQYKKQKIQQNEQKNLKNENRNIRNNARKDNINNSNQLFNDNVPMSLHSRQKRWLPDEVSKFFQ